MPRSIKKCPSCLSDIDPYPDYIHEVYKIQLITPLIGGGVDPGEIDPITQIRPSSIRGHLRFWWRAIRGARYGTVDELCQREGEVWGTTDNPSPVCIEVAIEELDEPSECAKYEWNPRKRHGEGGYDLRWSKPFDKRGSPLPYVLFPFQGKSQDNEDPKDPSKMIKFAQFKLIVHISKPERMATFSSIYNKQREKKGILELTADDINIQWDIEAAIWGWANFGGIGARTRRGCGALYCMKTHTQDPDFVPPNSDIKEFSEWLKRHFSYYGVLLPSASHEWPTFGELYLKEGLDPISSWEDSISVMRDLRQRDPGRDNGLELRPGRSHWPEPESLRNLVVDQREMKSRLPKWHPKDTRIPGIAFPRAEFGMPIIFEIRGEGIKPTLQPNEEHDRMASPLILRPIKFGNGSFASMIIRLHTPILESAYLKPGKTDLACGYTINASQIRDPLNAQYLDSAMTGLCDSGSALDALITLAEKRNFKEV